MLLLPMLKAYEWPLAICSWSSSSERPSRCRMLDEVGVGGTGEGEEEEEVESWGTFEEKRREALKRGNPVCWLHRRQKAIVVLRKTDILLRKG